MEPSQFVLSAAVFMVIATFMLSLPLITPDAAKPAYAAMTCRFERYCAQGTCAAPLPPEFRITPEGAGGLASLDMEGRSAPLSVSRGEGWTEYSNLDETAGRLTINLALTGAFSAKVQSGGPSGGITATGEGRCGQPVTKGAS